MVCKWNAIHSNGSIKYNVFESEESIGRHFRPRLPLITYQSLTEVECITSDVSTIKSFFNE